MNIYRSMYRAKAPEGIEKRSAHIVGGGIARLATAVFLIDDCGVPGQNITIYEKLPVVGGSMDGTKNEYGYVCRGERELEPMMECLWYLCSKIPSIDTPGRTILDETVDANYEEAIHSECRGLVKQGHIYEKIHDFRMSQPVTLRLMKLLSIPEEEIEDLTIEEFFGEYAQEFFKTSLWFCFSTMLSFKPYHSSIEAKRYWQRFALVNRIDYDEGILHTKYNEYDSIIKPIKIWLEGYGVKMLTNVSVYDVEMDEDCNVALGIKYRENGQEKIVNTTENDMVFITNGSMTQNSTFGDNKHPAVLNRDMQDRGVFTIWENLAKKNEKFGHPEKFLSDIDKTKWISVFLTVKDYPKFFSEIERLSGSKAGTNGIISMFDSSWGISIMPYGKYYPEQTENENVMWIYGLYGENKGDYVQKTMEECNGEEILTEVLYHMDLLDLKDELISHSYTSICMMPYITSQFMPRKVEDRPRVVPEGAKNYAFIGQYVELPDDVVFTVETSIRTALMSAYALTGINKAVLEVWPGKYDTRYAVERMRKFLGLKGEIKKEDLPKINPLKLVAEKDKIEELVLNKLNTMPPYYVMYQGKDQTIPQKESVLNPEYPKYEGSL